MMLDLKTEIKKTIKMLWSSDQHTVHNTTPTVHILSNLSHFYFNAFNLAEIDICVLGGDFFDHLVDASDSDLRKAQYWIKKFLKRCNENNVIVRVLEGTSSHDREQPEYFEVQKPDGLDLKWVNTLSIEYFPTLGFNVMYVPDNMGTKKPDEIWENALAVLSAEGLTKVDYIFFHGAFKYQIPAHLSSDSHDEIKWQSIVSQNIFAGHVHKPSEYGKIRVSGSFDRIAHGEEHPKGGYYVEFDTKERKTKATFWENKKAMPYITLKVTPEQTSAEVTEALLNLVNANIDSLIPKSRIRVKGGSALAVNPIVEQFNIDFSPIIFTAQNIKNEDQIVDSELYSEQTYKGVHLNKKNITDSLMQYLLDEKRIETTEVKGLSKLLSEFI